MKHHIERKPLKKIKLELVALGATRYQLSKPEIKELPKVLFEDENIEAFLLGFYEGGYGMMVATKKRLLFVDVMPFGRIKVDDIPYTMLGSTELGLGIVFGSITVNTRPKTYRFWWLKKDHAQDFHNFIEGQLLKYQREIRAEQDEL